MTSQKNTEKSTTPMTTKQEIFKSLCFKKISDSYSYGLLGELVFIVDEKTGFFNASKLCMAAEKNFQEWQKLTTTQEYISYLKETNHLKEETDVVYEVKKETSNQNINGIYVHPELILLLAQWISPEFLLKATHILTQCNLPNEVVVSESSTQTTKPKSRLRRRLNTFLLITKNSSGEKYPFYVAQLQRRKLKPTLKRLQKERFPNMEVVVNIEYNPQIVNLYKKMKENLKYTKVYFNDLQLEEGTSIQKFEGDMRALLEDTMKNVGKK